MNALLKINRLASWVLFFVILAYGITGYGMTKGLISPDVARSLHFGWLGAIGIIAFVIHTAWSMHLALRRNRIWNIFTKIGLVAFYVLLIGFAGYIHFFYQENGQVAPTETEIITEQPTQPTTPTQVTNAFTAETLKQYNGLNGSHAYVAVDGIVYDMSQIFRNGTHHGYSAGRDLSSAFHSTHSASYLKNMPVVGTYSNL